MNMYQSQCNAVIEVKRNRSEVLEILIQALLDVAYFQLVKTSIQRGKWHKSSGMCSGRIIYFRLQSLINFACLTYPDFLFTDPIMIFPFPAFIMTISNFIR
jgi:hypothetical protein